MTFDDDLNACAALVQRADPDRFLATMAAPVDARRVLFPLYALNVEVARAPWVTQEPMIAEMRLQWWRDALEAIAKGRLVKRHEVVTPLASILPADLAGKMDEYVAVRRWDIYKDAFVDAEHFATYLDHSTGTLVWVAARILGGAKEDVVRDYAFATGVANWFRAIPELEVRGRIPLLDGTTKGIQTLAQLALDRLHRARQRRVDVSTQARPALLCGWQSEAILKQVLNEPRRVSEGTLGQSEFHRRASLMWVASTGRW